VRPARVVLAALLAAACLAGFAAPGAGPAPRGADRPGLAAGPRSLISGPAPARAQEAEAPVRADDPAPVPPAAERPPLSVETLEFLPGQGRASRSFLLYQFAGADEPYVDLWDAVQILQANRYFDPVTRKVALGLGEHRVKLTDGSAWLFVDGAPLLMGAPSRIAAGRFYLPLSFWTLLLDALPDLPLRRDPEALRLIGGLRTVNVLGVEWIFHGERLRGVFQLSEPLAPSLERVGDSALRIRFPDGRLAAADWERAPARAPVDSLRAEQDAGGATLTLWLRRPLGELRSAADPMALTWALTAELPAAPGLPPPDFERELADRLPGSADRERGLTRIVLDPAHGGGDTGCVAGGHQEKDWTLRVARWLAPHLEDEGFRVLWTRRADEDRGPAERAQAANVARGDCYLSLHWTRRGAGGEPGLEIVVQEPVPREHGRGELVPWHAVQAAHAERSLELAASLQRALGVLAGWTQQGVRREDTVILEGLDMPALMLELGNLDSAAERSAWEDGPTREKRLRTLAQALAYRARRWQREAGR